MDGPLEARHTLRVARDDEPDAAQTRERFEAEAQRIAAATPRLRWERPSRHAELDDAATVTPAEPVPLPALDDPNDDAVAADDPATIAGRGVTRGLLLHARLEELVHGLLPADEAAISERAGTLLARLSPSGTPPDAAFEIVEPRSVSAYGRPR